MSVTLPLGTSAFFDLLRVKTVSFAQAPQQEVSMQGSGAGVVKDLGPSLWLAEFTTNLLTHTQALQLQALIGRMSTSLYSFYAYDPRQQYPQSDPTGSILGASTVKIALVSSPQLALKGLPAGYVITLGDYLCFDYGSPSSRALHQACETVTADGTGLTPAFDVTPLPRLGAAPDQVVTLIQPTCEMKLIPGSFQGSNQSRVKTVLTFKAGQWVNA